MTSILLRGTRGLVSLIVSLHVLLLRLTTTLADRRVAKHDSRVRTAQKGVEFAQQALRYARLSVREFRDEHAKATVNARNIRLGADAEARFYGRSL